MVDKARIINILGMSPPYVLYHNAPRPLVNWDTPDGQWVGIWGYDWADLLGNEVLRVNNEFEFEVWQPDLRADKIYSHVFDSGLVHRLFPAILRKKLFGFKFVDKIYSAHMIKELSKRIREEKIILHLNGDPLSYRGLLDFAGDVPIVTSFHGVIQMPLTRLRSYTKNVPSKFNHIFEHLWFKKNVSRIDYVTYQNDENIDTLRKFYNGDIQKVTMGCDFSFWRPGDRSEARAACGLPLGRKIFLTALRFVEGKQIDRLIEVFTRLSQKHDFILLVAGHGDKEYERYLKELAAVLLAQGKIAFLGYIRGERLRAYYHASDYYILTSMTEGASVSIINAFACRVPVISTRTGHTAELMEQHKCGLLLDVYNYRMWQEELDSILDNRTGVLPLDRNVAKGYYDWPNIARKFVDIYKRLSNECHANRRGAYS